MRVVLIWAQDRNGVIGDGKLLLWRVPEDLKHFQHLTTGNTVIMGRRTWESLPKPLPNRLNVVITRNPDFKAVGGMVVGSLSEALKIAENEGYETAYVIGGAQIYRQAIEIAEELVVTYLNLDVRDGRDRVGARGLVYAPKIDPQIWTIDENRSQPSFQPKSGDAEYRVVTYVRKQR